ncbi:MAG: AsmA-like C-terminal region-containing protein, partial [Desulfuromonadaceae bacterium]
LSGAQVAADKLVLKVGDNRAEIDFQIANLFDQPIRMTSLLRSERFLLDPLLKTGSSRSSGNAEKGTAGKQPAGKPSVEEIGPFDLPVELKGEVRIGQTLYRGLALEDFLLRYRLVNNVFTLEEMTGKMAGGTFREEATVDLGKKGLVYSGTLNLSGVQADPLLTALMPDAAGTVLGGLSLDTKFSGRGTLAESIRKNLSGKGNLELADGRLSAVPIMQGLANFLRLEELRDLYFSGAKGNYTLQNGKILLQSQVTGNDVTMSPTGSVGLDGSLDLQLGARLAPRLAAKLDRKGEISQLFTAQDGWTELPMQVAGSWSKPKLSLDTTAVTSKITEKAVSRLQQKLEEKAKKRQAEGTDDKSTQDPTKELINDALKGLFGK